MDQPVWTAEVAAQLDQTRIRFDADRGALAERVDDALQKYRFAVVRGIGQGHDDSRAAAVDTLLSLGDALGACVSQTPRGDIVQDIRDYTDTDDTPDMRGYRSPGRMLPHADPCTIMFLHCLQPARSGGQNYIVNSRAIHDRIARDRPDLLAKLYAEYHRKHPSGFGYKTDGPNKFAVPIFAQRDGIVSCVYDRIYTEESASSLGSGLTDEQVAALDLFDHWATSPELALGLVLEAGETLIAHNHSVLHSRADYEDWPDAARRRHLLRVWVDAPQRFPVAAVHEHGSLFPPPAAGPPRH